MMNTQSARSDTANEVLMTGTRYNGRMSIMRRFFCLLVTFDFLLTILMWLLCAVISGPIYQTAIVQQILHYKMETSLFDIVVVATCRFTILLLFYTLMDHWCVVALSTSTTCAFLLSKVFLYDWTQSSQPVLEVLFIIASFVLVWGEVWNLDITPQELQARNWYPGFADLETAPLLNPYVPALSRENLGNFYTPRNSPNHSDDEAEVIPKIGSGKPSSLPVPIAKRPHPYH